MKKLFLLLITFIGIHSISSGQTHLEQNFSHFIGNWYGSGTVTEKGSTETFEQTEEILWAAGKSAIVINGQGKDPKTGEKSFQAVGMIYYDNESEEFKMLAIRDSGESVLAALELPEPKVMKWGFDVPGGRVAYTTDLSSGKWVEKGSFSPEGSEQSHLFFEMELEKVSD